MSDITAGADQFEADQTSEVPKSEARKFREVVDEPSGQAVDVVRGIVKDVPLLALASAFVAGFMLGRRRL